MWWSRINPCLERPDFQMIAEMKDLIPKCCFYRTVRLSGFWSIFEQPSNLRVADYTAQKTCQQVEMGNILEKFSTNSSNQAKSWPASTMTSLRKSFVGISPRTRETHCGLGFPKERKKALSARLAKFSGKIFNSFISDQRRSHGERPLRPPCKEHFRQFRT